MNQNSKYPFNHGSQFGARYFGASEEVTVLGNSAEEVNPEAASVLK